MKRKELFEFEDFDWFPNTIRAGMTNLIQVFHRMMGTAEVVADLIVTLKQKSPFQQIVDLGSGSGGPMVEVMRIIKEKHPQQALDLLLTDLHPDTSVVATINQKKLPHIRYHKEPINAVEMAKMPKGLKTMIASFHHLNPTTAKQVLAAAEKNQTPILIFEVAQNNIPFFVWLLFLPLSLVLLIIMALCMTPFVKPLSFTQILFTYFIPVLPLVYAWDGQASLMRTYTFEDIQNLIGTHTNENYQWIMEDAIKANGKKLGYYLMGFPTVNEK